jgi:two-component system, sporulation sensor kinase C
MYTLYSPKAGALSKAVVADVACDALAMLEPKLRESGVQVDVAGICPGLAVLVPEGGLHQIVYNLLSNAIEASGRGRTVVLSAEVDKGRPDRARISVQDQGRGIPADMQPRIFEPFFTSRTDEDPKEGLGLGLSVVKSVVEAAGGRIEFESQPDRGTMFRVVLPISWRSPEE